MSEELIVVLAVIDSGKASSVYSDEGGETLLTCTIVVVHYTSCVALTEEVVVSFW